MRVGPVSKPDLAVATRGALRALELARTLSISSPAVFSLHTNPYADGKDQLTFPAPLIASLIQTPALFLRGWTLFESCIKGFNALGLMAEHVDREVRHLRDESENYRLADLRSYLSTRRDPNGHAVYDQITLREMEETGELAGCVDLQELAVWKCFGNRPIVCSTSSNLGISLHDLLVRLRNEVRTTSTGQHHLFNSDEGRLTIWCPDERADFMNTEKSENLKEIADSSNGTTILRSYIDRRQRDPAALRESLECGGYFFPTNPQSAQELQNLLLIALSSQGEESSDSIRKLIGNQKSRETLRSLGVEAIVEIPALRVTQGIESGIHGMMVPYFLLHEELAQQGDGSRLSVWNQASIGAALAAAVLADQVVENLELLDESDLQAFASAFPALSSGRSLRSDSHIDTGRSQIHGVFDLANIQSLAQLLGVVVSRHKSGRSTAYVGLGSASYSNGNRCFEILDTDYQSGGAFGGRDNFHPATHTVNPVAQALIYGEDVNRARNSFRGRQRPKIDLLEYVSGRVRKPEPAGAAALAGLLLYLLDREQLSVFELANGLRIAGFTKFLFLEFLNFGDIDEAEAEFLRTSAEEGPFMGQLAADLMNLLEWPVDVLATRSKVQRESRESTSVDSKRHDVLRVSVIYLTGDNTEQPQLGFLDRVIRQQGVIESLQSRSTPKARNAVTYPYE